MVGMERPRKATIVAKTSPIAFSRSETDLATLLRFKIPAGSVVIGKTGLADGTEGPLAAGREADGKLGRPGAVVTDEGMFGPPGCMVTIGIPAVIEVVVTPTSRSLDELRESIELTCDTAEDTSTVSGGGTGGTCASASALALGRASGRAAA